PVIPLAWPIGVGVSYNHIYVCDQLNRRIVRVDKTWAAEALLDADGTVSQKAAGKSIPSSDHTPAAAGAPQEKSDPKSERKNALFPRARVPFVNTAPKLDGKLDGEFWSKAAKLAEFRQNSGGPNNIDPKTEAYVVVTKDAFYVGLCCHEKDMKNLI